MVVVGLRDGRAEGQLAEGQLAGEQLDSVGTAGQRGDSVAAGGADRAVQGRRLRRCLSLRSPRLAGPPRPWHPNSGCLPPARRGRCQALWLCQWGTPSPPPLRPIRGCTPSAWAAHPSRCSARSGPATRRSGRSVGGAETAPLTIARGPSWARAAFRLALMPSLQPSTRRSRATCCPLLACNSSKVQPFALGKEPPPVHSGCRSGLRAPAGPRRAMPHGVSTHLELAAPRGVTVHAVGGVVGLHQRQNAADVLLHARRAQRGSAECNRMKRTERNRRERAQLRAGRAAAVGSRA